MDPILQFRKTTICTHFMNGTCNRGDGCAFIHVDENVLPCYAYSKGKCQKGANCLLRHGGTGSLPRVFTGNKQRLCQLFQVGKCERGAACWFIHQYGYIQQGMGLGYMNSMNRVQQPSIHQTNRKLDDMNFEERQKLEQLIAQFSTKGKFKCQHCARSLPMKEFSKRTQKKLFLTKGQVGMCKNCSESRAFKSPSALALNISILEHRGQLYTCSDCKNDLPISSYGKRSKRRLVGDGIDSPCRDCAIKKNDQKKDPMIKKKRKAEKRRKKREEKGFFRGRGQGRGRGTKNIW